MRKSCFIVLACGLAGILVGCSETASRQAADKAHAVAQATQSLRVGDVDVGAEFTSLFGDLNKTLSSVTNAQSAQQAAPQIEQESNRLNSLRSLMDRLPEQARPVLREMVQTGLGTLQPLVDKVLSIPGVRDVLGPKITPILTELRQIAG